MPYEVKATTEEILEFIHLNKAIEVWQLCAKFHYTDWSARDKLTKLKKAGLVNNVIRGRWVLTVAGEARVKYYAKRSGKS